MGGHQGRFISAVAAFLLLAVAFCIGLFKSVISDPLWYVSNHWFPMVLLALGIHLGHKAHWRWRRQ